MHTTTLLSVLMIFVAENRAHRNTYDTFRLQSNSYATFDYWMLQKSSEIIGRNNAINIKDINIDFILEGTKSGLLISVINFEKNGKTDSWFALRLESKKMKLLLGKNGGQTLTVPFIGETNPEKQTQRVSINRGGNAITLAFNKGRPLTFHISDENVDAFKMKKKSLLLLGRSSKFVSIFPQMKSLSSCITKFMVNGISQIISPETTINMKNVKRCQLSSATQCQNNYCNKEEVCYKTIGCDDFLDSSNIRTINTGQKVNPNLFKKSGVKLQKPKNKKNDPWILIDQEKLMSIHGLSITVHPNQKQSRIMKFYLEFSSTETGSFYPYTENGNRKIFSTMTHLNTTSVYLSRPVKATRIKVHFTEYNSGDTVILETIGCDENNSSLTVWSFDNKNLTKAFENGYQCISRNVYNMRPGFRNDLKEEEHFQRFSIRNMSISCLSIKGNGRIHIKYVRMLSKNYHFPTGNEEHMIVTKIKESCEGKVNCSIPVTISNKWLELDLLENATVCILYTCIERSMIATEAPVTSTIENNITTTTLYTETHAVMKAPEPPASLVYYVSCPSTTKRDILWPDSPIGLISQKCPRGASGNAYWWCEPGGWSSEQKPDLSDCSSLITQKLEERLNNIENQSDFEILLLAEMQSEILQDNETQLFGGDWLTSTRLVDRIMDLAENEFSTDSKITLEIANAVGNTVDSLLNQKNEDAWQDITENEKSNKAVDLANTMEKSAFLTASQSNVSATTISTRKSTVVQMTSIRSEDDDKQRVNFPYDTSSDEETSLKHAGSISLPHNSKFSSNTDIVFVLYENLDKLLGNTFIDNSNDDVNTIASVIEETTVSTQKINQTMHSTKIISKVISATVRPSNTELYVKEKVRITLNHHTTLRGTSEQHSIKCVFWNIDPISGTGYWSPDGCKLISTNLNNTECECQHLTSFAILMDTVGINLSKENELALSLITYIGCSMSVVCLLISAISFTILPGIKSVRTSIHRCLCFSLASAKLVFLLGVDHTQNKLTCSIIAAMLHYLFLVVFGWMCVEGYHLYISLVKVFEIDSSSRMMVYHAAVHIIPLIIVGVSYGVKGDGYGSEKHCWLSTEDDLMWAFAGPVLCVVTVNIFFLVVAMRVVGQHSSFNNPRAKEGKNLAKGSAALLSLLGITWIFGIFFVNNSSVVFAYAFTICNVFEGVFIFVFHCYLNEKVKKEWHKLILRSSLCPTGFKKRNQAFLSVGSSGMTSTMSTTVVTQSKNSVILTYANTLATKEDEVPTQHEGYSSRENSSETQTKWTYTPEWCDEHNFPNPANLKKTGIVLTTGNQSNNTNNTNNKNINNNNNSNVKTEHTSSNAEQSKVTEKGFAEAPRTAQPWKCKYSRSLYSKRPPDSSLSARRRPLRATLSQSSISSSVLGHETRYNSFMESAKGLKLTSYNTSLDLSLQAGKKRDDNIEENSNVDERVAKEVKTNDVNAECPSGWVGRRLTSLLLNVDFSVKMKTNEISTKL